MLRKCHLTAERLAVSIVCALSVGGSAQAQGNQQTLVLFGERFPSTPNVQRLLDWQDEYPDPLRELQENLGQALPDGASQPVPEDTVNTGDLITFEGQSNGGIPDTNGAAGDTQYVQFVNSTYQVYDKSTGAPLLTRAAPPSAFFRGMGCPCESDHGDGIVLYDKLAGRWLISELLSPSRCGRPSGDPFYGRAPITVCVAVSETSDATGAWRPYKFDMDQVAPDPWGQNIVVPDFPKWGTWSTGYGYTANLGGLGRTAICAFDRLSMIAGEDATAQCFLVSPGQVGNNYLPADVDGAIPPPDGSPMFFADNDVSGQRLRLLRLTVDWNDPSNSTLEGPIGLPVASFAAPSGGVPQRDVAQVLSAPTRLNFRLPYRNFGDHESVVATHIVQDASGTKGIRWYEIRDPNGSPFLYQQGSFIPDSTHRFQSSIAMDQLGNIAVGYSASSSQLYPAIRYAGRTADDPLGTLSGERSIVEGSGSRTNGRWGDYSDMTIDPVDDCTFWYTTLYLQNTGSRVNTKIARFKFPNCGSFALTSR